MVKEAVGRTAASCLSPAKAQRLIKEGAIKALNRVDEFRPFKINPPITLKVVFINSGMAEIAELVPDSKRVDGRTVSYSSKDLLKVYKAFLAMVTLAGTTV